MTWPPPRLPQDFQLGRGTVSKSRTLLDHQAYAARQNKDEGTLLDEVPRLSSCCLEVLADNYGEPGIFDALDPAFHRAHAEGLLSRLAERIGSGVLPFQVWLDFAHRFALDLPAQRRTYRDLCVSDVDELSVLKDLNAEAVWRWAQETAYPSPGRDPLVPPFYLAYLDLRNDTTFTDADIYKLRNPLSHFLAVLRLDNTSVSDVALEWIARAARDPPQYAQLQVLSLRGLLRVTDEGILKLSCLANLRSLDLQGTNCTPAVRTALNRSLLGASSPRFWRPPRPRADLPASLPATLEPQLFEPSNFSPSRVLATLHLLARVESSPPGPQRKAVLRARELVKPLGVHLTALARAPSAPPSATTGTKREQTADELYRAQVALSYGAKHAAHHAGLGSLTSTVPLSRELVDEAGRREADKGAAFRHRNDAVAAGEWVGAGGRTGGRVEGRGGGGGTASLYDVGTRRVSNSSRRDRGAAAGEAREPFSDSEGEEERDKALAEEDAADRARWEDEAQQRSRFYRAVEPPRPRGPRTWTEPLPSDLMLLRHVPYVPPWENSPAAPAGAAEEAVAESLEAQPSAGRPLVKKRQRPSFSFSAPEPSPAPSRTPSRAPPPPSSSSSSSSPAPSSNPFTKRRPSSSSSSSSTPSASRPHALCTARSASKNIVKTAPALPKRSALSAFRAKK